MERLSVSIGADVQELISKLKLTEAEFKKLSLQAAKSGKTVEQVLKESGKGAAKGISEMGKASANAVPTLTSFSQVIQDAPYGIRGVANNITQLTSQFGYLSKSAGGTGAALKSLLSTALGPAGILFAVSAITSALVAYGDKLNFAATATDKLAKASADYVGEATAEKVLLEQLVSIAQNENNSKKVRQTAIDNINKKYSKYLGNLNLESINTDKVRQSIDNLTTSLIRQAKIKGLEDIITETTKESAGDLLELEAKRVKIQEAINKRQKNFATNVKQGTDSQEQLNANLAAQQQRLSEIDKEIEQINKSTEKALEPFLKIGEKLKTEEFGVTIGDVELSEEAKNKKVVLKGIITFTSEDIDKSIKEISSKQSKLVEDLFNVKDNNNNALIYSANKAQEEIFKNEQVINAKSVNAYYQSLQEKTKATQQSVEQINRVLASVGLNPEAFNFDNLDLQQLEVLKNKIYEAQQAAGIFGNAVASSFQAMSSQMADALATGNEILDTFIGNLISSLANMISNYIQAGITQLAVSETVSGGLAIQSASQTAAASGPAAAFVLPTLIAAMLGLIASSFSGLKGFSTGGFTGDNHLIRVNGNEAVLTAAEVFSFRNQIKNHQLNSNFRPMENNVELTGEVILRGNTQVVQLRRAEKKMSRFYNS